MSKEAIFIPVGALAEGFKPHSHILSPLSDLAGLTLTCRFNQQDAIATCQIEDEKKLRWEGQQTDYRATSIRPGILFIDFIDPTRQGATVSLICNQNSGEVTAVFGRMPDEQAVRLSAFSRVEQGLPLTAVQVEFRFGRLNADCDTLPHFTDELLGLRNLYIYSPTERYEHCYLNDNFYAWHCLDGVEKGLADVDRCHYIKVADQLYLFVWQEKIIPTLGVILIDMEQKRTDGKIVGHQDNGFAMLQNFAVGAQLEILNTTRYPGENDG